MVIRHETPPEYDEHDEADYHRKQDLEENQESRPPDGETVRRPMLMLAECFVGGDLEGLVEGCRDLGMPDEWRTGRPDIYSWARQVRRTSRTDGWVDIGAAYPTSRPRQWMEDVPIDLPEDFERLVLKAYSPTPSVVFVIATFILTEGSALLLDDELRTDRFLKLEKRGSITRYLSASHRKSAALEAERARVKESASAWLAQTFAGTFSGDFGLTALPCMEFLTTQLRAPFEDMEERNGWSDYRFLLSIDSDSEAWESESTPGWRLGMPWRPKDDNWTIVVGCRDRSGGHEEPEADSGDERGSDDAPATTDTDCLKPLVNDERALEQYLGGLLIRFAAFCLIVKYEEAFGTLRDQLASPIPQTSHAITQLDAAQHTLSTLSFDASLVATELRAWASDEGRWRRETLEPTPAAAWKREHYPDHPNLLQLLGENVTGRADWVLDLEPRLRDQLVIRTSMLATSADLRLQRIVLGSSIVALVVACVSLIIR